MKEYANGQLIMTDTLALLAVNNSNIDLSAKLDTVNTSIGTTNTELTTLDNSVNTVNTTLGTTNTNLITVNTSIGDVNTTLGTTNTNLDTVNSNLYDSTNTQPLLTTVNNSLGTLNTSIGTVNTTLGTTNTKLDTLNTSVGDVNTTLGTTNTQLTDVNTNLYDSVNSQSALTTVNTNLTNSITQLTTANTNLTSLINKYLNSNDIPNIPLPYNYNALYYNFTFLTSSNMNTHDFTDADWGTGKNFYPISVAISLYSTYTDIGKYFNDQILIKVYNPSSSVTETLFTGTYLDSAINFSTMTSVMIQNPDFETGALSPWTGSGASIVTTNVYHGSYCAYVTAGGYIEQTGLIIYATNFLNNPSPTIYYYIYGDAGKSIVVTITMNDGSTQSTTIQPASGWDLQNITFAYVSNLTADSYVTGIKFDASGSGATFYLDYFNWTASNFIASQWQLILPLVPTQVLSTEKVRLNIQNNTTREIYNGTIYLLGLAK